jgi:hypothetical protein
LGWKQGYVEQTWYASGSYLREGLGTRVSLSFIQLGLYSEFTHHFVSPSHNLLDWKENLAEEINLKPSSRKTATPQRLMIELAFWWHVMLLHRHFDTRSRPGLLSDNEAYHVKVKTMSLGITKYA